MARQAVSTASEVHAYRFILEELTKKEWKKEQIYTQQECHRIEAIREAIGGLKPENVVMLSDTTCYVIEAKNERKKLDTALKEAREDYADKINEKKKIKALFITGIAGSEEEGYVAKSQYFNNGSWETITENEVEVTGLLSVGQTQRILESKSGAIADIEISEEEFHKAAEEINSILHENAINKDYRARFISALLLALTETSEIDLDESDTSVMIAAINKKVETILNRHGKHEFSRFIKIDEPSNPDNHVKVRAAIVKTIEKLLALNIRSAMKSGKDILGDFYEAFLKYGNGAKEIGVVLTPRHITRFAAEVLDIQPNDLVLDPACGTGGFLVAALDEARKKIKSAKDFDAFKENGIYGIEEQDPIIALAIVNMIFRGDGKNHMIEGNCFNKWLTVDNSKRSLCATYKAEDFAGRIPPITKVLMNPPFAQKSSKSKEYHFVEHALRQMQDGGVLFAVLPMSVLIEKSTKQWRKDLLKAHTLLAVVNFPQDLFYPTGTNTLGLFVKKGVPHPRKQKVFWARILHDGLLKKTGKRLKNPKAKDELTEVKELLAEFIKTPDGVKVQNLPEQQKAASIEFEDDDFELVPERYLDDKEPTYENITEAIEQLVKETAGYLLSLEEKDISIRKKPSKVSLSNKVGHFDLSGEKGVCEVERKYAPYLNEIESDTKRVPYVTTTEMDNGVSLRCDTEPNFKKDSVSVSLDGTCGTTFYQFEDYIAGEKTAVLTLKGAHDPYMLLYIAALIRIKAWRYHYGRKLSMGRLNEFILPLPIDKKGNIDAKAIESIMRNSYGWEIIDAFLPSHV